MSELKLASYQVKAKVNRLLESVSYNHHLMNIPAAWKFSKGGGIKVGVLDTGCPDHDDLSIDSRWSAFDSTEDKNGHATHVAGIIGARENERGIIGIAPRCALYSYKVLNDGGEGSIYGIAEGITQAVSDGCDIINVSIGLSNRLPAKLLQTACELAAAEGIIIVAAAGNDFGMIDQPACYDSVIAVGAVNQNLGIAYFSNYGKEMDFAAGGVDIFSTWLENSYARLSGTSMAAPVITGLCALILGEHRSRENHTSSPKTPINNVLDMVEHIKRFAYDLGPEGFDEQFGYGIPIFQAPEKAVVKTGKQVILEELAEVSSKIEALRQAVKEL